MLEQREQTVPYQGFRGLVAGDKAHDAHEDEFFVAEPVATGGPRGEQLAYQVVTRPGPAFGNNVVQGLREHFDDITHPGEVRGLHKPRLEQEADVVRPLADVCTQAVREQHPVAHDRDRQRRGEVGDGVHATVVPGPLYQVLDSPRDTGTESGYFRCREHSVHQSAQPGVVRVVGEDERLSAQPLDSRHVVLRQPARLPADQFRYEPGAEGTVVQDAAHVGVPREHPHAQRPVDRPGVAKLLIERVGGAPELGAEGVEPDCRRRRTDGGGNRRAGGLHRHSARTPRLSKYPLRKG